MNKLCFIVGIAISFAGRLLAADQMPTLSRSFVYEDLYKGHGMTAIDFDPTGALFVCEKMGRVLLFEPKGRDFNEPVVLLDLKGTVNPDNESGLLGIAVDPQFNTNHFIYIFYTTSFDQQLARYTLNPGRSALTDPLIMLKGLPRVNTNHKAGDIHFSPNDPNSLFVILGNDAVPNSAELVNNLDVYNGKLLRLNKANGQGLPDNPFFDGNPDSVKSRVWAMGLRNPFRFTFAPSGMPADTVYISENGDGTDRQAMIKRGADGGWSHGGDRGLINPPDPNAHVLITKKPSLTGVAIAEAGTPFGTPSSSVYYFAKWYDISREQGPGIYRGTLGPQRDTFTPIPTDLPDGLFAIHLKCVNLKFGPDGALYTTDTTFGASDGNGFRLGRIKYDGSVLPEVAAAPAPAPSPTAPPPIAAAPQPGTLNPPVPASAPATTGLGPGPAILKNEVVVKLQYGDVHIPARSVIKLIAKTGDKWTAQWQSNSFTVDESDLVQ